MKMQKLLLKAFTNNERQLAEPSRKSDKCEATEFLGSSYVCAWHFPEKNNGFPVILLLFTKAKIKHWRTSFGGLRRKQEHVADIKYAI